MIGSKEYEEIVERGDTATLWKHYKELEMHTCDIMNKYHGRAVLAETAFSCLLLLDIVVFVMWLIFRF